MRDSVFRNNMICIILCKFKQVLHKIMIKYLHKVLCTKALKGYSKKQLLGLSHNYDLIKS